MWSQLKFLVSSAKEDDASASAHAALPAFLGFLETLLKAGLAAPVAIYPADLESPLLPAVAIPLAQVARAAASVIMRLTPQARGPLPLPHQKNMTGQLFSTAAAASCLKFLHSLQVIVEDAQAFPQQQRVVLTVLRGNLPHHASIAIPPRCQKVHQRLATLLPTAARALHV